MLVQQVLHVVDAEPFPFGVGKQHILVTSLWLPQPGFSDGARRFSDGCASFFASLADDAHVSAGSEDEIHAFQPGHF